MKQWTLAALLGLVSIAAVAQEPVTPAADQAAMLKSSDPHLARNKKLVFDFWREALEARHTELADKYLAETYIQHNPNVKSGREGFKTFFSRFPKQDIKPTIQRPLVSIVAEGDLVSLAFVDARPVDPADKTKTYTTTAFDLFRIENGKIAEHWDTMPLMTRPPQ